MIKMTVACTTGMSANVLSKALQAKADQRGMNVKITGCGVQEVTKQAHATDIVIVGPQIGFSSQKIKEQLNSKCAVIELSVTDFNINACTDILDKALQAYKK